MDWKLFATTFITIFIAELGDKTQFAAIAAGSRGSSYKETLLAVVLALSLAGAIGVLAGRSLAQVLDPRIMRLASGILFLVIGVWILADARAAS